MLSQKKPVVMRTDSFSGDCLQRRDYLHYGFFGNGTAGFGCAWQRLFVAVVTAQIVEQGSAHFRVEAGPARRNGCEVGWRSVVAWLGFWLDGGDGITIESELGPRAGAVVGRGRSHLLVDHLRGCLAVSGEAELFLLRVANVVALILVEIDGRDLEAIKQETSAAEVDVVAGDGLRDAGDGLLNVEA